MLKTATRSAPLPRLTSAVPRSAIPSWFLPMPTRWEDRVEPLPCSMVRSMPASAYQP